jgi:hypothetical protein
MFPTKYIYVFSTIFKVRIRHQNACCDNATGGDGSYRRDATPVRAAHNPASTAAWKPISNCQ